jgi:hypothetical protein
MTFPTTSATIARTDAGQTFTGTQAFGAITYSTLNGNTWAAGTGTLSIAASKTLTASNTLTFTGTDSSSVAFGTGGTVLYSASTIPLTVGSTTIASGTTTRILYDNAGTLGEYTITGTGTIVAMAASPTLTGTVTAPTFNATTQYNVGGAIALSATSGNAGYTSIYDSSANIAGYIGGSSNAANYWQNTTHYFRDRTGATTFASISSSALTSSVALNYGGVTLSNSVTGTGSMVLSASPSFTGAVTLGGALAETFTAPTISAGTLTISLANGTVFNVANSANITTFTISNAPASKASAFTLVLTANGTGYTQTWGASVNWSGGTAPTLTTTNAKRDIIMFFTNDGGTTWFGTVMGQNF